MVNYYVHPSSVIDEGAEIGEGTKIWHFTHIMGGAKIGKNCTIGQGVFIQDGVEIGDDCKIQNGVSIYKGVVLKDHVFIGPHAVFTNVRKPRADIHIEPSLYSTTYIYDNVTIGANATIVCGIDIGHHAFIGAGAVVTKTVPPNVTIVGNPAGILVRDTTGTSFVISFEQYLVKKI